MSKKRRIGQNFSRLNFRTKPHSKSKLGSARKVVIDVRDVDEAYCLACGEAIKDNSGHGSLERHITVNHKEQWRKRR